MTPIVQLDITLQLRSPLCLARRPTAPGQSVQTLDYISGTALRGGLAAAWLRGRKFDDLDGVELTQFADLFTVGTVGFCNCLPVYPAQDYGEEPVETLIVPATASTRKRGGGWLYDQPEPGSGVLDMLKYRLCAIDEPDDFDSLDQRFVGLSEGRKLRSLDVRRRQFARTAVDNVRGTARTRQLYSFEAIEVGQRFSGSLRGPKDRLDHLCSTVVSEGQVIFLGQGRSRGLGEVVIDTIGAPAPYGRTRDEVMDNIQTFNSQVRSLLEEQPDRTSASIEGSSTLLPVTLLADMLLRDNYLLPSSDPMPTVTLGRYLPLPAALAQAMRPVPRGCVHGTSWISGWDEVRGLPRPPQLATVLGSVWTFVVPNRLLDDAVNWWVQAEAAGLGDRRNEGYGQIQLCHPLHLTEGLR